MADATQKPYGGFDDTPILPNTPWHVHDYKRPQPQVVDSGTAGVQDKPGRPPSDAIILFDGKNLSGWVSAKDGKTPAQWKVENGYMEIVPSTGNIRTIAEFGDCQLHVEWTSPTEIVSASQGRGNSGVFIMGLYEIQVLDCFQNPTYADGTTAAVYGQFPPLVNACRKPGEWNTYDILWRGPRFQGEKLISPAYVTVLFNGVVVHHHVELQGPTQYRALASYKAHPSKGPLELQDHSNPVRFRNIWYRPIKAYDQA